MAKEFCIASWNSERSCANVIVRGNHKNRLILKLIIWHHRMVTWLRYQSLWVKQILDGWEVGRGKSTKEPYASNFDRITAYQRDIRNKFTILAFMRRDET